MDHYKTMKHQEMAKYKNHQHYLQSRQHNQRSVAVEDEESFLFNSQIQSKTPAIDSIVRIEAIKPV